MSSAHLCGPCVLRSESFRRVTDRMPFEFVEDAVTSDVTFRAWAGSLDALFGAAIDATAATMVAELDSILPQLCRTVAVDAHALDLLLLRVLEESIFIKDTE